MPVRLEPHSRNAGGVNYASYFVLAGRLQNSLSAFDIRAIHLLRIANPQPIVRGDVKHHIASRHGFLQRRRIAQISNHPLGAQFLNIPEVAAGADQESKIGALRGQSPGHVTADESCRAREENQHLASSNWPGPKGLANSLFANFAAMHLILIATRQKSLTAKFAKNDRKERPQRTQRHRTHSAARVLA